jgi:hypothetical protein
MGVYMPAGYITYTCAFESDYRNGEYATDKVGKLFANVPWESTDWGDGIKLTITPEVKKEDVVKTLKAIIKDIEQTDTLERLKKIIQKREAAKNKPTKHELETIRLLEKGYTLMDLKKFAKESRLINGGKVKTTKHLELPPIIPDFDELEK